VNYKARITRAAELECLPVFRDFIQETCNRAGLNEEISFALQLSVDEACTNIITHGYAGLDPGTIIVNFQCDEKKVIVQVSDFGHPFEPSEAPMPDVEAALEDRPLGGFGLFFIYQSMDTVDYQTNEDGNSLILTKYLQPDL
jgi:serine/threonine-protein kinase RsbW